MKRPQYDVAISFAGEDRALAQRIVFGLVSDGLSVFYDRDEEDLSWGKDLYSHLTATYRDEAKYCLMLISRHYAAKQWTNHERKAAQSRAFSENREYILPLRLDDTPIDGLLDTLGYIDARSKSCDEIVDLVARKVLKYDENEVTNSLEMSDEFAAVEELLPMFVKEIGQAFGFHVGQHCTLQRLAERYPTWRPQIKVLEKQFSVRFGGALSRINLLMFKYAPNDWKKMKERIRNESRGSIDWESLTDTQAREMLAVMQSRSEGHVESPILETLLMFVPGYEASPEKQFVDGYRYRFCSDGLDKAKGLEFCLEIPRTWKPMDGNRPNIVKKFVSQNGKGSAIIIVIVKDMPMVEGENIVESDIDEMLRPEQVEELLPKDATHLGNGSIYLEGAVGYWIRYKSTVRRVRATADIDAISYIIFFGTKFVQIQGICSGNQDMQKIDRDEFKQYERVFELVANSLVLNNLYQ